MASAAIRSYLVLDAGSAFVRSAAFSIAALYRFREAGLSAFQLVIVGTAMEIAVLVFEVPTGVVADVISRKLSIWIGHIGMGLAFLVEALHPSFAFVLAGQIMWGIAYTFTSGATAAWLAGELDDDRSAMTKATLRASRWSSVAGLIGLPVSFGLGAISLRLPLLIGGVVSVALGVYLAAWMPETGFTRATERSTWASARETTRLGFAAVRRSRILLFVVGALAVSGAMEPFDRFASLHVIRDAIVPARRSPFVWLTIITVTSALIGIAVSKMAERIAPRDKGQLHGSWIVGLAITQALAVIAFGLAGSFVIGAICMVVVDRARSLHGRLLGTWLVPLTPRDQRATVFSVMGQCNSLGEMTLGPALGAVAATAGMGQSLVTGGLILLGMAAMYGFAVRAAR